MLNLSIAHTVINSQEPVTLVLAAVLDCTTHPAGGLFYSCLHLRDENYCVSSLYAIFYGFGHCHEQHLPTIQKGMGLTLWIKSSLLGTESGLMFLSVRLTSTNIIKLSGIINYQILLFLLAIFQAA